MPGFFLVARNITLCSRALISLLCEKVFLVLIPISIREPLIYATRGKYIGVEAIRFDVQNEACLRERLQSFLSLWRRKKDFLSNAHGDRCEDCPEEMEQLKPSTGSVSREGPFDTLL